MHRTWVAALTPVVLLAGCERQPLTPDQESEAAQLSIHATLSGSLVNTLVVEVTAADIDPGLVFNLVRVGDVASGTITVPVGPDRLITARGFDGSGGETHRGSAEVDIHQGINPSLRIVLAPLQGDQPIELEVGTILVIVSPAAPVVLIGDTVRLKATVLDGNGDTLANRRVIWGTLAADIAAVDTTGLVTARGAGSAQIVAVHATVGGSAAVDVTTAELTRVGTSFLLDGEEISPFGLRLANALQDDEIADRMIAHMDTMLDHGIQSFSLVIQGGRGEENGNSLFNGYNPDGTLGAEYVQRLSRILNEAALRRMVPVVVSFYQGRDEELADENAVRAAVAGTIEFLKPWRNLWYYVANEPYHTGYNHAILETPGGYVELYDLAKLHDAARIVYASHDPGANEGFLADTWGRNGLSEPPAPGDVSIEAPRYDTYAEPGVFLGQERDAAMSDITAAHQGGAYYFWHAAWHQKADLPGWPRFDKGGAGTGEDPGTSFAWDTMSALSQQ